MRYLVRTAPLVLAILVALGSGPADAAKRRSKPHCAVPRGWTVVGRNRDRVVIGKPIAGTPLPYEGQVLWDYCLRPHGRFRRLTTLTTGPYSYGVGGAKLVGPYFGYWEAHGYHGAYVNATLSLWNLATRHVAEASYNDLSGYCAEPFGSPSPGGRPSPAFPGVPAGYLLTPTGVAAWIADRCAAFNGQSVEDVEAVDSNTDQVVTLDTAPLNGVLANLQLYQCAAGCAPNVTTVSWTHSGTRQYATIQ